MIMSMLIRRLTSRKKKMFIINEKDIEVKGRYLGNVQTSLTKGDGCVDKPADTLWKNYVQNSQTAGLEMTLSVTSSGLKARTKEQGLTEYRSYRISYCIAHPDYPRLFIWVYRHDGKKMKVDLRCHAFLCKTETQAKAVAVGLHAKVQSALKEFKREKTRKQNARKAGTSLARTKFLHTGQNFKPSVEQTMCAPKQNPIIEEEEEEEEEQQQQEQAEQGEIEEIQNEDDEDNILVNPIFELEVGNDLIALQNDEAVRRFMEEGEDSSESGFSEAQTDSSSNNSTDSTKDTHTVS
ncbi:unnamed protein product [Dimorphilus gyrociliatus]|uniref:PID domain-containing protein n=1 Tax=Dimorphilus gyrociliatus TaxID=2664684 RepID=A0A7I8VMC0_9ANNE|nr:unnamed protein product [Dimorphilus gyrociliatus]